MKLKFDKRYLGFSITSFIVIMVSIFSIFSFINITKIGQVISNILRILSPITYGVVISYLLTPSVNYFHTKINKTNKTT